MCRYTCIFIVVYDLKICSFFFFGGGWLEGCKFCEVDSAIFEDVHTNNFIIFT